MMSRKMAVCVVVLLALAEALPNAAQPQQAGTSKVIVLGVGTPAIGPDRAGTSVGIAVNGTLYLFDAGAGVERRIFEAHAQLAAWNIRRLGPVFITHLHMDHTLGLAALYRYHQFSSPGTLIFGNAPLAVFGPPGIRDMMNHVAGAFEEYDLGGHKEALPLSIHELGMESPGIVYHDANVTVRAFVVRHKGGPAVGYRVETPARVIVVSGDTRPVDATVDACNGCDILFHEVCCVAFGPEGPANDRQEGHTSAAELGELARRARPKLLVLYHTGNGVTAEALIERIRTSFDGPVRYSHDLDVY